MSEMIPEVQAKKKRKPSQNRHKSRELALKAIYRSMINEGDIKRCFRLSRSA